MGFVIEVSTGKVCNKCGNWKEYEEFYKKKTSKDGYMGQCKICKREQQKKYYSENADKRKAYWKQYRQENVEKVKETNKQWRDENKEHLRETNKQWREENREYLKEYTAQYYQDNAEHFKELSIKHYYDNIDEEKEYHKKYYRENAEKVRESQKQWRKLNAESRREYLRQWRKDHVNKSYKYSLKRRSYKHKVNFTPTERIELLDRDNWTCQCCGTWVHDVRTGDWDNEHKAHIDHIIPISKGGDSTPENLQVLCRTCNLSKGNRVY